MPNKNTDEITWCTESLSDSFRWVEDTSFEDLNELDVGTADKVVLSNDSSMDLSDLLQQLEEEETDTECLFESNNDTNSVTLVTHELGSKLQLEDLPSPQSPGNGNLTWASILPESFRKRTGIGGPPLSPRILGRKKDSVKSSEQQQLEQPRKKVVRFKKFETVFNY